MTRVMIVCVSLVLCAVVCSSQTARPTPKSRIAKTAERSGVVSEQVQKRLIQREKELAAAEQRHAVAVIDEALSDDFHEISSDGRLYDKAYIMPLLPDVKIEDYSFEDFKVLPISNDSVLITYIANVKGTFKGEPFPPSNRLSTVWVRRHGSWRVMFHQATPVLEAK
jgi:hypothetical protein